MRFALFALPALALATPVVLEPRATDQFKAIQSGLTTLNKDVTALNTTLNGIKTTAAPTSNQQIALLNAAQKVSNDLASTNNTAVSSSALTSAESTTIYNYLSGTVYTSTASLLNNFIAHYPGFSSAGLVSITLSNLQQQQSQTDTLANSLTKISTGTAASNAAALKAKFDSAFAAAEKKYSS